DVCSSDLRPRSSRALCSCQISFRLGLGTAKDTRHARDRHAKEYVGIRTAPPSTSRLDAHFSSDYLSRRHDMWWSGRSLVREVALSPSPVLALRAGSPHEQFRIRERLCPVSADRIGTMLPCQ